MSPYVLSWFAGGLQRAPGNYEKRRSRERTASSGSLTMGTSPHLRSERLEIELHSLQTSRADFTDVDERPRKDFLLTERFRLQFRTDFSSMRSTTFS